MEFNETDIFSIEDAEKNYLSYSLKCTKDEECPFPYTCYNNKECKIKIYCTDSSRCTYDSSYITGRTICEDPINQKEYCNGTFMSCRTYNETSKSCRVLPNIECLSDIDCLSNKCDNKTCIGSLTQCYIGGNEKECGLMLDQRCEKNDDCFEKNCRFNKCSPAHMLQGFNENGKGFLVIALIIIAIIIVILFVIYKKIKAKKNKNKNKI